MSRNNDVFRVLVTSGNQALPAAGAALSTLSPGQIGVFNAETNVAIDAATAAATKEFFLAVGIDDGAGALGDINKSSGSMIQKKNMRFYNAKAPVIGVPMIVNLVDYTASCETEYGIKLEMRNQEIYRTQGFNQFFKSYFIKTNCCDGCSDTCPNGDGNEITKLLKAEINNDPSGLVIAKAIARTALVKATIDAVTTGVFSADIAEGAEVSDADLLVLMEFNSLTATVADWLYTDLQITTVTKAITAYNNINLQYFYPRENWVNVTKVEGFSCNGEVVVEQALVFEEGSGYDVQQLEFQAGGFTGKQGLYRLSTLNGVANENILYSADSAVKYHQYALTYDQFSLGGWLEYLHNLATVIAVPTGDATTKAALEAVLVGLGIE